MPDRITSLDVARRAGVSRSAVSRVFTPGASASAATVDKVRKAAAELGYRPNVLARSLLTGRTGMIGLVVSYLDNLFYPDLLDKLCRALKAEGYHVLMFISDQGSDAPEDIVTELLGYQVDGLLLASVPLTSDLTDQCRMAGIPAVLLNRRQEGTGERSVVSDNVAGGAMAAKALLRRGCTRIGHIAGSPQASTQVDREAGLMAALAQAGVPLAAREVGDFDLDQTRMAARAMFARPDRPDGVFVANDYMALAVMDVLRTELGLRVPDDVAVIGFDDAPAAAFAAYELTTIRQDADAMVALAVRLLTDPEASAEVLPVTLVQRVTA
ncbi:MAG: LacI family DNA-binding transcriptional regulator [Pseudomonadota bacterium]